MRWSLVANSWIRCGPSVAGLNRIIGCRYWRPSWIVRYGGLSKVILARHWGLLDYHKWPQAYRLMK
jgi:hypothetical protein